MPKRSVRWLMGLVLLVALVLYGFLTWRRMVDRLVKADQYRREALAFQQEQLDLARLEREFEEFLANAEKSSHKDSPAHAIRLQRKVDQLRSHSAESRLREERAYRMHELYKRAANHPWEPINKQTDKL